MSENTTEVNVGVRNAMIGNRISRKQLAAEWNVCKRSIDNLAKKYNVPYVALWGERYFDPAEFRTRIEATLIHETPRRGRPRKVRLPEAAA